MRSEHQKANADKSSGGAKYENVLLSRLKKDSTLKIRTINKQKKFYYKKKTPAEEIAEAMVAAMLDGTYNSKVRDKLVDAYLASKDGSVIRDENKFFKRADITFNTEYKYFIDKKLRNIRVIIDTTTSARGDRLKAKAQDCLVYKSLGLNSLYIIVLPNDDYFAANGYDKPANEIKQCKNAIYDHNFCDLFKNEGVDLIVQEDDLIDFIKYIGKRKQKNIEKLVDNWKKSKYNDMYNRRKIDYKNYRDQLSEDAEKIAIETVAKIGKAR